MAQPIGVDEHPFVRALPPSTDYFSYLTIVEENLNKESLPLLNRLLQNKQLTINIGWDLVHLLAPLVPESSDCLDTVARFGNPREVILKVNELLETISRDSSRPDHDVEPDIQDHPDQSDDVEEAAAREAGASSLRLRVLQFTRLLHMITILHPRIETKRPSKFLATITEAILSAYSQLCYRVIIQADVRAQSENEQSTAARPDRQVCDVDLESITKAVVCLLAELSRIVRPPLPPRAASTSSSATSDPVRLTVGEDPEAEPIDPTERDLQRRMLICFGTQISEIMHTTIRQCFPEMQHSWTRRYVQSKGLVNDLRQSRLPGDSRNGEPSQPGTEVASSLETALVSRLGLKINNIPDLLKGQDQDALYSSAEALPSDRGMLYLYANSVFRGDGVLPFTMTDHRQLVSTILASSSDLSFGPERLVTIDAILFLGWVAITSRALGGAEPQAMYGGNLDDDVEQDSYNRHLQQLSVISANAPSPELRYQAHCLVSRILRQTASTNLKLGFIQDTLQFCPFPNLKVTAVGWLKDELLAAAQMAGPDDSQGADVGKLARPETLESVVLDVFDADDAEGGLDGLAALIPFWLAGLNFLYLICRSVQLRDSLNIPVMARKYELRRRFVDVLDTLANRMLEDREQEEMASHGLGEGALLKDAVSRVKEAMSKVGV